MEWWSGGVVSVPAEQSICLAPKGQKKIAQGFSPGSYVLEMRALKVAPESD
jgi:hypothetical protein